MSYNLLSIVSEGLLELWVRIDYVAYQCAEYTGEEERALKDPIENELFSALEQQLIRALNERDSFGALFITSDRLKSATFEEMRKQSLALKMANGCSSEAAQSIKSGLECQLESLGLTEVNKKREHTCLF